MKAPVSILSDALAEALTLTILHSLWQGLIIFLVLRSVLLFIPGSNSNARYWTTAACFCAILFSSIVTFTLIYSPVENNTRLVISSSPVESLSFQKIIEDKSYLTGFLEAAMEYVPLVWLAGCFIYFLRVSIGYVFLCHLRRTCTVLRNDWSVRMNSLAERLNIRTTITLAESARVYAPVVIGYLKPLVILPAGLMSGLTADQLEAILIHELVHIKRNDYLLNLVQCAVEGLFFYNPFVWLISSRLRTEREHCCDDAVILHGVNSKAYVYALASIEQSRPSGSLAVSLAGNKNQLLQRIKRIMEKSVKNYSLREKMVPLVLVLVGLLCASWFSIQKPADSPVYSPTKTVQADTSKKNKKEIHKRKSDTTKREDRSSRARIPEDWQHDGEHQEFMSDFHVDVPPFPDFDIDVHVPPIAMADFPDLLYLPDSIPVPGHRNWKVFEEEFTKRFQQRFGDFFLKNQGEFEKMMKELETKFNYNDEWAADVEKQLAERAADLAEHQRMLAEHHMELADRQQHIQEWQHRLHDWEKEHASRLKELEESMEEMQEQMKAFESELKEELIRDGYLKKGEKIENLHWNDEGDIEINGKKIKAGDEKKYRDLHRKHFNEAPGQFHYSE